MDRKIKKTPYEWAKHVELRDIRCLRIITWKLLRQVESSAELYSKATLPQLKELEKRHNLLFGKTSLANTLVTLSDLLIKLNQQVTAKQESAPERREDDDFLSEFDKKLLEDFVADLKQQHNTVVSVNHEPTTDFPVHTPKAPIIPAKTQCSCELCNPLPYNTPAQDTHPPW